MRVGGNRLKNFPISLLLQLTADDRLRLLFDQYKLDLMAGERRQNAQTMQPELLARVRIRAFLTEAVTD